jgi:hypothetical protein
VSSKQDVPRAEVLEEDVTARGPIIAGAVYEVCSWRPGPPNSGPCTEVHLLVPVMSGIRAGLRLKSARALDELVAVLLEYRKDVWP